MLIDTIEINGHSVEILADSYSSNPRKEFEYTSTLAINSHGGDIKAENPPADSIYLPVYRYEHGGVAYKTTPFTCPWDSGLTGYIWESRESIRKEFGVKRITPKLRQKILERMQSEIQEFGFWANGEIYGYSIESLDDSCFGFYGYDSVIEAATESATN